jgi:hypothetical protein
MKLYRSRAIAATLVAVAVVSAVGLAGCTATSPAPASSESGSVDREASSYNGTRICILNDAGDVEVDAWQNELSVAPFSGSGGAIAPGQQRCFTGKEAFLSEKNGTWIVDMRVDVFIGATPDIITFTGHNGSNGGLAYTLTPNDGPGEFKYIYSEKTEQSLAGHTFSYEPGPGLRAAIDLLITITS